MFETLECQNLNKLSKSKVRDFASPEAFHTVEIQRFGRDKVKTPAQVGSKFIVPITPLVGDMPIETCEFMHSTPPVARTFDFTRKTFVEFAKFFQGFFQELRRLYLLPRVQREKSVFHTEVCAYTFTRSRQDFFRGIIGHNIKPIRANTVAKDLEITDVFLPIAVLVESEPTLIKLVELLRFRIPLPKRDTDTSLFKFVARLELRRAVASFAFELRFPRSRDVEKNAPKRCAAG